MLFNNTKNVQDSYKPSTKDLSKLSSYHYELPDNLIAQQPSEKRDQSSLMVIHRDSGAIENLVFSDLEHLLSKDDLLVMNNTKVIPVALKGRKVTGGAVELLCLSPSETSGIISPEQPAKRECFIKSSKRLKRGAKILLDKGAELELEEYLPSGRARIVFPVIESNLVSFLEDNGQAPLPPYIRPRPGQTDYDKQRYQTVYSKLAGSVAAPTAGLHFTEELLDRIRSKGIEIAEITLHVGPGTFSPIRTEDLNEHKMEKEKIELAKNSLYKIRDAKAQGKRIIAVGTTSVRTLESLAHASPLPDDTLSYWTDLFIKPGYEFKLTKGLITNFHLPGSTLLALVCAFGGYDLIMGAYEQAIKLEYRFYSYGDACLII